MLGRGQRSYLRHTAPSMCRASPLIPSGEGVGLAIPSLLSADIPPRLAKNWLSLAHVSRKCPRFRVKDMRRIKNLQHDA